MSDFSKLGQAGNSKDRQRRRSHIYEGRLGDGARMVIGHEPLGVIDRVGSSVSNVRVGDRVTRWTAWPARSVS